VLTRRFAWFVGIVVLLSLVQCASERGESALDGPRISYQVTYADGRPGKAHLKYFSPKANRTLEEDVDTPWTSEIYRVSRGTVLRVEAVGMRSFPGHPSVQHLYGRESVREGVQRFKFGLAVRCNVVGGRCFHSVRFLRSGRVEGCDSVAA
jgi:hypothetical protein